MADARPTAQPEVKPPYGMNAEQWAVTQAIKQSVRGGPFSIGAFCQTGGGNPDRCVVIFPQLVELGVLRCPVNDGGCNLFQLVPEFSQ